MLNRVENATHTRAHNSRPRQCHPPALLTIAKSDSQIRARVAVLRALVPTAANVPRRARNSRAARHARHNLQPILREPSAILTETVVQPCVVSRGEGVVELRLVARVDVPVGGEFDGDAAAGQGFRVGAAVAGDEGCGVWGAGLIRVGDVDVVGAGVVDVGRACRGEGGGEDGEEGGGVHVGGGCFYCCCCVMVMVDGGR